MPQTQTLQQNKGRLQRIFTGMTRLERAVLVLFCLFCLKLIFSTAAHFIPALQPIDALGSGRHPVDIWLLLFSVTALLGLVCLLQRVLQVLGVQLHGFHLVVLLACAGVSGAFYLAAMAGRHTLYLWDNATYYNLQVRLESNFADGVFFGVGATAYKTWFNDYAPLVINTLTEPFFMFTNRTANTYAMLGAVLIPAFVYFCTAVLLAVLARRFNPTYPKLFYAGGMVFALLLPLLHAALYRGMPDLLGVAFALLLLALAQGYDFTAPGRGRLVCMAILTALLMLTRRCYMFTAVAFWLLYGIFALWRCLRSPANIRKPALCRFGLFAGGALLCVGLPLVPMFYHIVGQNYADRYATYQTGGFAGELANQIGFLGLLVVGVLVLGLLYGLWKKPLRTDALLAGAGAVATVFLVTRVQNMDDHQSLAVAPFYLLAGWLLMLAVANINNTAMRRIVAAVLAALCCLNFAVCATGASLAPVNRKLYSGTILYVDADRQDFEQVHEVNAWLKANCTGENSAYMICHGLTYSPDVFREMELPDETIRSLLPYGACNPGNDAFPVGLFYAQAVLTCTPFDPNNHTEKMNAAFRQVVAQLGCFEQAEAFDMGNGYVVEVYRRTKPVSREEVEIYRAALQEEDERFPYNFSQVFDSVEENLPNS